MDINSKELIGSKRAFILWLCLFTSVDTILFGTNSNSIMVLVPRIMSLIGIILMINFRAVNKRQLLCLNVFLIITICSFVFNDADISTGISKILFILLGFSIATRFSIKAFFDVFDRILFIVACCAIGLEIIAYVAPSLCEHFLKITNESGIVYYSIILSSFNSNYINSIIIRSSGIYWEAGAFAVYLLFGLIAQLFVFEETNIKKLLVYLVCMFLTFSTTGAIAVSVLLVTYLVTEKGHEIVDRRIKCLIILVAVVFVMIFILGEQNVVFDTLFGKIINNSSTTRTRMSSLIVPFEIAKSYPLFGVSPNRMAECMRKFAIASKLDLQASSMCTNTLTYQFASYGYIYGALFLIRNWFFCKRIGYKKIGLSVGLMLAISLAYCGENLYSFLPYVFVFMSYRNMEE